VAGDHRNIGRTVAVLIAVVVVASACAGERPAPSSASSSSTSSTGVQPTAAPTPTTLPPDPLTSVAPSTELASRLDPIWARSPGGCLTVASNGAVLYEAGGDALVPPASAIKVVTAAVVLDEFGAAARLTTTVRAAALPVDGVIDGDVWLVGGGDPVLGTDAWATTVLAAGAPRSSLDSLADAVVAVGVRRVEGRVVGDDSRFDAVRFVESWPERLVADGEAGPLSALSVNDGFRVWGHPGVPFSDPPAEAAGIFVELLAARGVEIVGGAAAGGAGRGVQLGAVESPPIGDLVWAMLRDSDNGTAELLLKELGARRFGDGSTAAGLRVVEDVLRSRGVQRGASVLADGSGLSELDRVSCRLLTAILTAWQPDLDGRLAVAGRDGTLRRRFVSEPAAGRLRGKTGSLDGMTALAGYADNVHGATLTFAVIVSGYPVGSPKGRAVQDAVSRALVESLL
jgi:D-alanyl-D-alanine carboxypeptidase/D-alanyl-D-alanine-endopeptidase (penicillin-binding protein 4)